MSSTKNASAAATATTSRNAIVGMTAPEGEDGAQHREPQEQDAGKLVRPHDRRVEDVTADDAGEQHADLGYDEERRGNRDAGEQAGIEPRRPGLPGGERPRVGDLIGVGKVRHHGQASLPETFSSCAQASSPNFAFQSA